ncbi:MAG: SDR family NAD(P)-dependent oxidoreductase [Myxococcales bacterium]|nr:SDR family NAD(P)-dependent oxidoreductase [Myxococcales bacterium]
MSGPSEAVAVIGMSCRLPGADSPAELWRNLRDGVESITFFDDEELKHAGVDPSILAAGHFVGARGVLNGADTFDAGFFGINPKEAACMDPQQRILLETAWSALEDAGYDSRNTSGRIGVFAGSILSMYLLRNLSPNRPIMDGVGTFQIALGNDPTFLATSISYHLDLRGPSVSVGTACSTSLVAVHMASQSLLAHESDMALAGGVSVHLPLVGGHVYEDGGILSPDGHCRPFDASAQGTVSSDGSGMVVLKRLSDAVADGDLVRAIIRGSAVNNDGRNKVGYTAPSGAGEASVVGEALAMAGFEPASLSFIETHGAGTLLGDPIEVAALTQAFGDCDDRRNFCALGSLKSNLGHVDAAAGIAGLIKTVLVLQHRAIPPTLHFDRPNPGIGLDDSPFYVNSELVRLDAPTPLRAGVSSFGIGGTNAHVVLEEAPRRAIVPEAPGPQLLTFSARTATALDTMTHHLADSLPHERLSDIAFTLREGRRTFTHRRFLVASTRDEVLHALRTREFVSGIARSSRPAIAFLFPGLGEHYPGMGRELYRTEAAYRNVLDEAAELLQPDLQRDIREWLFDDSTVPSKLNLKAMLGKTQTTLADDPIVAQPSIFATEVALAALLQSRGIEPEAMLGHSIGEFASAHIAGVLSLSDALQLVATRARLIQERVGPGRMLAVPLGEAELRPLLPTGVYLAAINAERLCVASGETAAVDALARQLAEGGVSSRALRSTRAYHSPMMEAIVAPLTDALHRVKLHPPRIPYVSCITGTWVRDDEATDPAYWAQHVCRTVRMQSGLDLLLQDPQRVLVEAGPGRGLASHAIAERARIEGRSQPIIPTMRSAYSPEAERAVLLRATAEVWLHGGPLPVAAPGRRAQLPTYPFERQRYWIDPVADKPDPVRKRTDIGDWFYLPYLKPSATPHASQRAGGSWLVVGDTIDLAAALRSRGCTVITAPPTADFAPVIRDHRPQRVVHLGSFTDETAFDALQDAGLLSLVRLIQAIDGEVRIDVVAKNLSQTPGKATLRAPVMVAPQEHPGLVCRCIDTDTAAPLLDELLGDAAEPFVTYRNGRRTVLAYEPVRLQQPSEPPFRHLGVYLITGGFGAVGMVLAQQLAKTVSARLVLVGRSEPTPEQRKQIDALGTEVLVQRADVSSRKEMRRVLANVDRRFGGLHGVLHCAGAVGPETFREIREVTLPSTESQFTAKVRGVLVLDELLNDRDLDFVVLFSSLSAILGGLGFCSYSAANLFMDAFANARRGWISVDWDSWRLPGKAPAIAGLGATVSPFTMEPEEGFAAFERIIAARTLAQVVVSSGDLQARLCQWVEQRPALASTAPTHQRPNLDSEYEAPRGDLECTLSNLWQELFGMTRIGVRDNFFELGGHSLLATQLNARLSSRLNVQLSLAALLQAPTIAELAVLIVSERAEQTDPGELEQLLDEVTVSGGGE